MPMCCRRFFARCFVHSKNMLCFKFLSCAFNVPNPKGVRMRYMCLAGSNLRLFRRFLGTKVERSAGPATSRFPVLRRVENTDDGKTSVRISGRAAHPKLDQL